jgi:hypothetical protein
MQSHWWSVGGALFVVLGASSACSNRPGELVPEKEAAPVAARVPDSLARQADAETLKNALKGRLSRTVRDLPVERTAVGSKRISLEGRFRSVHVATIDQNGKKHIECATTNGELAEILKKGARK